MKLTTDVINGSVSRLNSLNQRELVLRDLQLPAIENLGVTKDLNDTIDFSNNDLRVLGNFPRMVRLQHLLLANNRINKIELNLAEYVPNLTTAIMTNNSIHELGDLEPLAKCKRLTFLSLLDNPVTKKQYYRAYLIHKLPRLRVLDFKKVKQREREEAAALFMEDGVENSLGQSITDTKSSNTFEVGEGLSTAQKQKVLSKEEQLKIKEALKQATSLDEISRLEQLLKAGQMPKGN
ncbi:leucine-rich repeat-domain-containing protein [Zychaea mexicana]|uniref:leucine-rich repeat-domain-containing protein n=1 Tax=Zychaea mexicana TaxID=64656 RepID=UPI0022FF1D40|nr:leucine-rich repeat-domain-containing protein [Zychaea mexicana]KAI9499569.1 leucine-rich repeat-domain-containing protein [Zychaea mexicana]